MRTNGNISIIEKIISIISGREKSELETMINHSDKEDLYKFIEQEFLDLNEIKELIASINIKQNDLINIFSDIIELYLSNTSYNKVLKRTSELIKQATSKGFDWSDNTKCFVKVEEEIAELKEALITKNKSHIKEELGDVIFTLFSFARLSNLDMIDTLEFANKKFDKRFKKLSEILNERGIDLKSLSDKEKEELWQKSKLANKTI
jgi:uncharacterized protein YabN with tetrapyrrole methylase and pyrophosphatase domain